MSGIDGDIDNMRKWMTRRYETADQLNPVEANRLITLLTHLQHDLGSVIGTYRAVVDAAIPQGSRGDVVLVDTETGNEAKVRRSPKKRPKYAYDDDEVLAAVLARSLDERRFDPETGDPLERESDTTARVLGRVWPLTMKNARVTQLREMGIEPDDYRERLPDESP